MPTRYRKKSPVMSLLGPLLLIGVALYFGWQSTRGDFGQVARERLASERDARAAELSSLVEHREALQRRVERLRTDALDADLLDERARAQLNLAHTNELVILHGSHAGSLDRALAARR